MSWTAWDLTHSTAWLAIVALADATANIVLMPLGGVLADRGDRLRILMISYACATAQAAILAGLAFSGALTIHALTALAAVHGAAHAFSIPASYGLLPRFIAPRRLPSAIAVGAAYSQLGLFVGPALAGWIILRFGTPAAFASNVARLRAVLPQRRGDAHAGRISPGARGRKAFHARRSRRRRGHLGSSRDQGHPDCCCCSATASMARSGRWRRLSPIAALGAGVGGLSTSARQRRRRGDGCGAVACPRRRRAGLAGDHPMGVSRVYRGRFGPDAVATDSARRRSPWRRSGHASKSAEPARWRCCSFPCRTRCAAAL